MDVHPTKNGIYRYWSIPCWHAGHVKHVLRTTSEVSRTSRGGKMLAPKVPWASETWTNLRKHNETMGNLRKPCKNIQNSDHINSHHTLLDMPIPGAWEKPILQARPGAPHWALTRIQFYCCIAKHTCTAYMIWKLFPVDTIDQKMPCFCLHPFLCRLRSHTPRPPTYHNANNARVQPTTYSLGEEGSYWMKIETEVSVD
jgi:hypothetical protein